MSHSIFGSLALTRGSSLQHPRGREAPSLKLIPSTPPSDTCGAPTPVSAKPVSAKPVLVEPLAANPESAVAAARPTWLESTDVALIAILEAPLHPGETTALGFARKEAELRQVLASLSIVESRAMHLRLSCPREGDPLPRAFLRLTGERRARVINFIADARRRGALAGR